MRYVLLICDDEIDPMEPAELDVDPDIVRWIGEAAAYGVTRLCGTRLRPTTDATTVRVRADEAVLTDGPFAETKELVGGFDIIECDDLDQAIGYAARHPAAAVGAVEIRPVWEL